MPSVNERTRLLASSASWYGRMLVSEVRSFAHRIRMLSRKRNRRSDPIDLGPMFEESPTGETVPCKATIARTQYVEFLLARFPWASDADILLALDGWDKGTKCGLHTEGTDNTREVETREQYHLTLGV
jgi:hypothetical protein